MVSVLQLTWTQGIELEPVALLGSFLLDKDFWHEPVSRKKNRLHVVQIQWTVVSIIVLTYI